MTDEATLDEIRDLLHDLREARAEIREQVERKEEAYRHALGWRWRYEALVDAVSEMLQDLPDDTTSDERQEMLLAVVAEVEGGAAT